MADNITLSAGTADGAVLMTDQDASAPNAHAQINKLAFGPLNTFTLVTSSVGLPVGDAGGSLTVDNGGTFAVQAAATEADGANVTLGAKADAKSTATDTTAVTIMQVLKQISASVQAPPSQAVTNAGTFAVQAGNLPTTVDTNSGVKSASTLRVVLATDQPALTNKLLVTPDSVALPANQSVNVSQVNGVTTLMGNGVTGTGSQRVTIASDNTAFSVNANPAAVAPALTTMQNAATANANGTVLTVAGYATAVLNVTTSVTASGGTLLNFEASVDGTTFVSILGNQVGTNTIAVSGLNAAMVGDWEFNVAGYTQLRARISAYSAGTITVKGYPTTVVGAANVVNANAIQSGTWTVQPGNTANTTPWLTTQIPATSGGLSISRTLSAANTTGINAKGSAGQVYGWVITNTNASARFVKLYNKATAPTVGTDTPVITLVIPGNATGAGMVAAEFTSGIAFATGIGYGITGAVGDADTTAPAANEVVVTLLYK